MGQSLLTQKHTNTEHSYSQHNDNLHTDTLDTDAGYNKTQHRHSITNET